MENINEVFRNAVTRWLKDNGISYETLAQNIGCAETTLYKYLKGETDSIRLDRAIQIANLTGIDLTSLTKIGA